MRLLLAFDSFKGSLSSQQVGEAFAAGWCEVCPDDAVELLAIADGGEGTAMALCRALRGELVDARVSDPLGREVEACYAYVERERLAIVDVATASGLMRLAPSERDPLKTSSWGTGELIAEALRRGCRRIIVGLGGSATNDGGMGLLRALGYRFYDNRGAELMGRGEDLARVSTIDDSRRMAELDGVEFIAVSDVENPLYGSMGAARIFARQKGGNDKSIELLDMGLRNYVEVVARHVGHDASHLAGAGAAGGIGFALMAMMGSRMRSGIDTILDTANFDDAVAACDLVVTGEGSIDRQTLMGKAPSGVLRRASMHGVPTIAVGGRVEWCDELRSSDFYAIYAATPDDMPLSEALHPDNAKANVRRIASHIASTI